MTKRLVVFIALLGVLTFITGCSQSPLQPAEPPKVEVPQVEPTKAEPTEIETPEVEPPEEEPPKVEPPKLEPPRPKPRPAVLMNITLGPERTKSPSG